MPIDFSGWEDDLRSAIEDMPVIIRYKGEMKTVHGQAVKDGLLVMEGGTADDVGGTILAVLSDFPGGTPQAGETFEIRCRDLSWREVECKSNDGGEDPNAVHAVITYGSPFTH